MGKEYPHIDSRIKAWIAKQKIFFVATAPLSGESMINCSPKGMDTLRVIGVRTIAYLDLTGSGIETVAHLRENQRIVIMMCSFEGPPKIFRFHGSGRVLEKGGELYKRNMVHFPDYPGARCIIEVNVARISDSCGYSLPLFKFSGERDTLIKWSEKKGNVGVTAYQKLKNRASIDGLPALEC